MRLKAVKDHDDSSCERCCLTGSCIGSSHSGTRFIDGIKYNCNVDNIIYKEVEENMSIEDLKKSVEMWVWDDNVNVGKKEKAIVIHINVFGNAIDSEKNEWKFCEEIKEPAWRPYTKDDDVLSIVGKVVKSKDDIFYSVISSYNLKTQILYFEFCECTLQEAFNQLLFSDGTPFGVKI